MVFNTKQFKMQVLSLVEVFEDMWNPFLDRSEDLTMLYMGIIMGNSVVDTVFTIEALGREQICTG